MTLPGCEMGTFTHIHYIIHTLYLRLDLCSTNKSLLVQDTIIGLDLKQGLNQIVTYSIIKVSYLKYLVFSCILY